MCFENSCCVAVQQCNRPPKPLTVILKGLSTNKTELRLYAERDVITRTLDIPLQSLMNLGLRSWRTRSIGTRRQINAMAEKEMAYNGRKRLSSSEKVQYALRHSLTQSTWSFNYLDGSFMVSIGRSSNLQIRGGEI